MNFVEYDDLINGAEGFTIRCNHVYQVLRSPFEALVNHLSRDIIEILENVENNQDETVEEFMIGETYVNSNDGAFVPLNSNTWNTIGIQNAYDSRREEAYTGLIVLYIATQNRIPRPINRTPRNPDFTFYNYALDVSRCLTSVFTFKKTDDRIRRRTQEAGSSYENDAGVVVYMAFKLRRKATQQKDTPSSASSDTTGNANPPASVPSQQSEPENIQQSDPELETIVFDGVDNVDLK